MSVTLNNILDGGSKTASRQASSGGGKPAPQKRDVLQIDWGTGQIERGGTNVQTPQAPETSVSETAATQAAPQRPVRLTYEEMFRRYFSDPTPTQEELEKERKKQRREQIFAAIGDGISALSNLYFTTQYAPNMYSGRNTDSRRVKDRWDKLAADRNANMKAYIDSLMKARQADDAYNDNEREWERQLGLDKIKQDRDKAADARAEAEEERKKELYPYAKRKAEGDAQRAEAQAKYAEEYEKSRIGRNKAAAGASDAAAVASRARARNYDGGGSGRTSSGGTGSGRSAGGDVVLFATGNGRSPIRIPKNALNHANLSYVYHKLPKWVQDYIGKTYGKKDGQRGREVYTLPDDDTMLWAIGRNIDRDDAREARAALMELAGDNVMPVNDNKMPGIGE